MLEEADEGRTDADEERAADAGRTEEDSCTDDGRDAAAARVTAEGRVAAAGRRAAELEEEACAPALLETVDIGRAVPPAAERRFWLRDVTA